MCSNKISYQYCCQYCCQLTTGAWLSQRLLKIFSINLVYIMYGLRFIQDRPTCKNDVYYDSVYAALSTAAALSSLSAVVTGYSLQLCHSRRHGASFSSITSSATNIRLIQTQSEWAYTLLGRIAVRSIVTEGLAWSVCRSVCLPRS